MRSEGSNGWLLELAANIEIETLLLGTGPLVWVPSGNNSWSILASKWCPASLQGKMGVQKRELWALGFKDGVLFCARLMPFTGQFKCDNFKIAIYQPLSEGTLRTPYICYISHRKGTIRDAFLFAASFGNQQKNTLCERGRWPVAAVPSFKLCMRKSRASKPKACVGDRKKRIMSCP